MTRNTRLRTILFAAKFSSGLFLILVLSFFLSGCAPKKENIFQPKILPLFYDDSDRESLQTALLQQQHYLDKLADDGIVVVGKTDIEVTRLRESLKTFIEIIDLEPSPHELDRIIKENFTIFQAGGRNSSADNDMLVTGYFEPILQGSLEKVPPFIYPVYSPPPDLIKRTTKGGTKKTGRIDKGGSFQPYWTREEIDNDNLLEGNELAYLKDRFDTFLLHVQGSGKIQLRDGSLQSIHYSTNNGHAYSSIGKLLVDEKKMLLEDVDIPAIRKYLQDNPSRESRILNHNLRYIFFQWGEGAPTKGSIGEPLTPGRSIAIDKNTLPMGMVGYLVSQIPVIDDTSTIIDWVPLQRFVLPQDSGSAIKGAGRVDLFWGNGKYAEIAAGAMKEKGKLYFLLKNDFESPGKTSD
jgi:membrane-bound lytic murein transglycosylase A